MQRFVSVSGCCLLTSPVPRPGEETGASTPVITPGRIPEGPHVSPRVRSLSQPETMGRSRTGALCTLHGCLIMRAIFKKRATTALSTQNDTVGLKACRGGPARFLLTLLAFHCQTIDATTNISRNGAGSPLRSMTEMKGLGPFSVMFLCETCAIIISLSRRGYSWI